MLWIAFRMFCFGLLRLTLKSCTVKAARRLFLTQMIVFTVPTKKISARMILMMILMRFVPDVCILLPAGLEDKT